MIIITIKIKTSNFYIEVFEYSFIEIKCFVKYWEYSNNLILIQTNNFLILLFIKHVRQFIDRNINLF